MCASVYVRAVGALVNHFITGDVNMVVDVFVFVAVLGTQQHS